MRAPDSVERVALGAIGREVMQRLPKGVGFAMFLRLNAQTDYLSNAAREDVQAELRRWLDTVADRPVAARPRSARDPIYERLAVELATEIAEEPGVACALFVFSCGLEPGEGGFAWKITDDGFLAAIREFCKP